MLASSPTMSASGTDHTSGTSAKISRPSPGPTEWINVSVVYGPPEVEKKRTKTSPSVPIARGSFCLIDHASMTTSNFSVEMSQESRNAERLFRIHGRSQSNSKDCVSFFSLGELCVVVLLGSPVTLCPQRSFVTFVCK